jgi:hypothetical protein
MAICDNTGTIATPAKLHEYPRRLPSVYQTGLTWSGSALSEQLPLWPNSITRGVLDCTPLQRKSSPAQSMKDASDVTAQQRSGRRSLSSGIRSAHGRIRTLKRCSLSRLRTHHVDRVSCWLIARSGSCHLLKSAKLGQVAGERIKAMVGRPEITYRKLRYAFIVRRWFISACTEQHVKRNAASSSLRRVGADLRSGSVAPPPVVILSAYALAEVHRFLPGIRFRSRKGSSAVSD